MTSATRVACNKEGDGVSGKSNGNEGGGRATVMMWVMAMATRWAGDKEGKGKGGKGNGHGDEGGGQQRGQGRQGNGDGNKGGGQTTATATKRAKAMATRVAGKQR
jgi:hypothetical protein